MEEIKRINELNSIDYIMDFSDCIDKKIAECGPAGFLSLIHNAEYIYTDSFHCTVFSLLFEKKFEVFRRKQSGFDKMFGRIEDLLSSKGKLDCIYAGTDNNVTNDFEEVYIRSVQYIENILGDK